MKCTICTSPMSEPVEALFALPSVASDCRPWSIGRSVQICSGCGVMKRVTNAEFNPDVYKDYTSYPEPTGRTKRILEFVKDKMPLPKRVLDIGAGNGHGMRVMGDFFPDAMVFGYEPTISTERPANKFDLITLFQVFEHVEDLHEMLAYVKASLAENGHLLIQVPYAAMWSFDLIVADHEWHFTMQSLATIVGRYLGIDYCGNDVIKKELTILASVGTTEVILKQGGDERYSKEAIDWLLKFKNKLALISGPVAIYGTSVSAIWTAMMLGDNVECYVDDDENRLGEFNGKRVHSPYSVTIPVVAPFPDWQLAEIRKKHPDLVLV